MLLDTSVECTCYQGQSIKSLQPVNQQMAKIQRIGQGGKGRERGVPITHHADFFQLSRITERQNKILTTLTSILLSFDLRKSEVEEQQKGEDVGVITIYF